MNILVFKTDLQNQQQLGHIGPALSMHPQIIRWNVDLEDCDSILRVVPGNVSAKEVEQILVRAGHHCEELV
ncbi:MAG: hypothetical protein JWQ27_1352 [Ferruginibacter sp.]|nr:hypothetical protein [Ferruginibacter sp.]